MNRMILSCAVMWSACAVASAAPLSASELDGQLRDLSRSNRGLAATMTIGESREGRPIHLLRLGEQSDAAGGPDQRPALLIVAGANADHHVGTDVAMGVAASLLQDHADALATTTVYIVPRLNPDGAAVLGAGGPMQSHPGTTTPDDADGDGRVDEDGPNDLNGDGVITMMRVKNPPFWMEATLVVDPEEPRLMRAPKAMEGEIATYAVLIESVDDDGDGAFAEDGPGGVMLDMNFMHQWPEHKRGAGMYPLSESESHALVRWMLDRPNIQAVLTFGPHDTVVSIPQAGKMDITGEAPVGIENDDKALYEKISEVFKEITSINASSDADDDGAFHAWAYAQFGVPSFSTPVWVRPDQRKGDGDGEKSKGGGSGDENAEGNGEDAPGGVTSAEIQAMVAEFQSADQARQQEMMQEARSLPPEVRRRVMAVAQGRPDPGARSGSGGDGKKSEADKDDVAWLTYSDESRNGEGFIEWTSFDHPQLGEVEIGGFVPGFKLNPPPDDVAKLIDEQTAFAAALLERLPRIDVHPAVVERVGDGVWRISLEAVNTGLFPSQIATAKKLRRLPGVTMIVDVSDDRVLAGAKTQQQQGLDGSGGMARAEWLLVGNDGDTIDIIVRAPALGETRQSITLND